MQCWRLFFTKGDIEVAMRLHRDSRVKSCCPIGSLLPLHTHILSASLFYFWRENTSQGQKYGYGTVQADQCHVPLFSYSSLKNTDKDNIGCRTLLKYYREMIRRQKTTLTNRFLSTTSEKLKYLQST